MARLAPEAEGGLHQVYNSTDPARLLNQHRALCYVGSILTDPVLIVEILSHSNQAETWANVWVYATIPSVREILVLRSVSVGADLLRRRPDGAWPQEPVNVTDGNLVLDSIGLKVPLADIYRTTRLRRGA